MLSPRPELISQIQLLDPKGYDDPTDPDNHPDMRLVIAGHTLYVGSLGTICALPLERRWADNPPGWWFKMQLPQTKSGPVSLLSQNQRLFAGSQGYVYELDLTSGAVLATLNNPGSNALADVRLASDGIRLFVGRDGLVEGISVTNKTDAWQRTLDSSGKPSQVMNVLSRNNQLLAGYNGTIYRLDPTTGALLRQIDLTSPGSTGGNYETKLNTSDGQVLFVGVHGYAYALSLNPIFERGLVGEAWHWVNEGKPQSGSLGTPIGVNKALHLAREGGGEYWPCVAFLSADGSGLFYHSTGTPGSWGWVNQSKPAGVDQLSAPVGVVTYPGFNVLSLQYPLVFVQGNDGTVWYFVFQYNHDRWVQLKGTGPGGPGRLGKPLGVLPASSNKIAVLSRDENDPTVLWCGIGSVGADDWTWGRFPVTTPILESYGVYTQREAPTDPLQLGCFFTSEGRIAGFSCSEDFHSAGGGSNPTPAGLTLAQPVGALTVQDTPLAPQRLLLFVLSSDGHLWVSNNQATDVHEQWEDMGQPTPAVSLVKPVGVFTVQESPVAPQRAHAFVLGSDGNLWVRYDSGPLGWLWAIWAPPQGGPRRGGGCAEPHQSTWRIPAAPGLSQGPGWQSLDLHRRGGTPLQSAPAVRRGHPCSTGPSRRTGRRWG